MYIIYFRFEYLGNFQISKNMLDNFWIIKNIILFATKPGQGFIETPY